MEVQMKRDFTASVYILENEKVLLIWHRKLQKWLPPGGHLEPNETPPEAARREVLEETGLEIEFIQQENIRVDCWNAKSLERPYMCLLEEIPAYKDQPAHQHIDMIYLAHPVSISQTPESGHDLRWFDLENIEKLIPDVEIFVETLQVLRHLLKPSSVPATNSGNHQIASLPQNPSCNFL